jgi:hypothetical protein
MGLDSKINKLKNPFFGREYLVEHRIDSFQTEEKTVFNVVVNVR